MREPEKYVTSLSEMPGNHPDAYDAYVFIERRQGETTDDLLSSVLQTAAEIAGIRDGLGVHEGGAEICLVDGQVLEAVGFGSMTNELRLGAETFATRTGRSLVSWSADGKLEMLGGLRVREEDCKFIAW